VEDLAKIFQHQIRDADDLRKNEQNQSVVDSIQREIGLYRTDATFCHLANSVRALEEWVRAKRKRLVDSHGFKRFG